MGFQISGFCGELSLGFCSSSAGPALSPGQHTRAWPDSALQGVRAKMGICFEHGYRVENA